MTTTKGTKRVVEAALDVTNWSTLERLIVSQALYEFGVDNMPHVATLMSSHAMLSRPKNFFTFNSCSAVYEKLMEEAGLSRPEPASSRHSTQLKQLATIHYQRRMLELQTAIDVEEAKFKAIVREIDEIRAGLWDDRIQNKLGLGVLDSVTPEEPILVDTEPEITEGATASPQIGNLTVIPLQEEQMQMQTQAAPEQHGITLNGEEEAQQVTNQSMDTSDEALELCVTAEPHEEEEEDIPTEIENVIHEADPIGQEKELQIVQLRGSKEPEPEQPAKTPVEEMSEEQSTSAHEEAQVHEPDVETSASPGSESLREAKRKASEAPSDATRDRKRMREDSEAMEEEDPGPSTNRNRKKAQGVPDKKFQNVINMLHSSISQHRYGNIFHNPIKKQDAADYHDIVKRPIDLKTIKQRVKEGVISNSLEFQRDVYLMFANAMIYNRPGSEIYGMAEEMMLESEIQINAFRQTEGFHRV